MSDPLAVKMGLLAVMFLAWSVEAQEIHRMPAWSPDEMKARPLENPCAANEKADEAEYATLRTYTSPALEKALLSDTAFWDFITDPSTSYLDRMAAAYRGGAMFRPEELPLLWGAMAEVDSVPSGVNTHPCSAVASMSRIRRLVPSQPDRREPREQPTRMVLGHAIQLPQAMVDYPVTAEARESSPWIWQMNRALDILFTRTNLYYGDPSRYPERVKAAWDWQIEIPKYSKGEAVPKLSPAQWGRISLRTRALTESAPHDVLFLQTILKLALNDDGYADANSMPVNDLRAWGKDSFHYEELIHAAQIVILQRTSLERVAAQTAFLAQQLANYKRNPRYVPHVVPLQTATAVLAIGRWATDKSVVPWSRYFEFAAPICRIMSDPPISTDQLQHRKEAEVEAALQTFDAWFEEKKPELEKQAEAERAHLQELADELGTKIE